MRSGSICGNSQNFGFIRSSSRFSKIDKTVIGLLPFFWFSSLKGSNEGLEFATWLSKLEDAEILRILPKCKHSFHIDCIDNWLEKHSSSLLCRSWGLKPFLHIKIVWDWWTNLTELGLQHRALCPKWRRSSRVFKIQHWKKNH